ncbi:uncharacterized protein LOC125372507 [Haliotis rufescens]|uniref:uncharacterized protein LOC125372507 n=1 Tax=Haliotis rufescens TaxID=6454 RepID=UPI00201ED6F6|nr:uncharacterized protein LOC125372507 [Haliotis rufescens]
MKEMRQKTERINLGVLEKNEQYNDQMTDICEFIHKFVPGHSEEENCAQEPQKVLSGGDYLTYERHKQAKNCKSNCRTPSKQLKGLVPKIEEFHNQAEFLKLIWSLLYDTSSSNSIGTLYAARNKMNSRNVPSDPHDNFYASSEFMDKVTTAYIIAGGLHHFKMENLHSKPKPDYAGPVGDHDAMKEYIMEHAHQFVENHAVPHVQNLPDYGIQSNDIKCRYCDKEYRRPMSLRKHEARIHGHPDPQFNQQSGISPPVKTSYKSSVYDYTKLCLTLGLLRLNHNDAIRFGDGERLLRLAKFFCLYYKGGKCPKYAFALLETTAQAQCLLSERQAERFVWNRTVNHQGKIDTNHPNDLDLEHCNKVFKEDVHTYRGKYTEKTILRVSRSALATDGICKKFDNVSSVRQCSGKHKKTDMADDIQLLAEQLHSIGNVFDIDDSRVHDSFPNLKDPLASLNMEDIQTWISGSLKKFSSKHYV